MLTGGLPAGTQSAGSLGPRRRIRGRLSVRRSLFNPALEQCSGGFMDPAMGAHGARMCVPAMELSISAKFSYLAR